MAREAFSRTIEAIYRAAADPGRWSAALESVADHVGGSGGMLVHNDYATRRGTIVNGRLRDDLGEIYIEHYPDNPLVLAIARRELGKVVVAGSLVDKRSLRRTAFHADILAPQHIVDLIALPIAALADTHSVGGFGVTVTGRQMDDAAAAAARMTRLAPHLARAFDLSLAVTRQRRETGRFEALIELLPTAAMLLDRSGRLVRANERGERLFRRGDGITVGSDRRLSASLIDADRWLRRTIDRALLFAVSPEDGDYRQALSVQRPSGLPPLLVIFTPLFVELFPFADIAEEARLLVQIFDPVAKLDHGTSLLQAAYGLTAAEARIAILIGSGRSAPQAALALGISPATIRTHLARCFEKTGVRSQVGLSRLVTAIVSSSLIG